MSIDVSGFKQGQRAMWTAGDYPARSLNGSRAVGEWVAERVGRRPPGVELLDVATGTGNVSVPAALAGATVTGLDLTPKLLDEQRRQRARARRASRSSCVEGDAEELPFADGLLRPRHVVLRGDVRAAPAGGRA